LRAKEQLESAGKEGKDDFMEQLQKQMVEDQPENVPFKVSQHASPIKEHPNREGGSGEFNGMMNSGRQGVNSN